MEDKQFSIHNFIVIGDNGKSIEIKDQNGNSISLNANGITINSSIGINIVTNGNVKINSDQELTLSGLNVNALGKVGFVAKGNATAEISAMGQTTVKGGIVM